jgi:hypothetical protein
MMMFDRLTDANPPSPARAFSNFSIRFRVLASNPSADQWGDV